MGNKKNRPNILFITGDQMPASVIGAYGNPIVKTPRLDELAEQGVLFNNCYTNSPICVPARASFYSGRYISKLGVFDNGCEFAADIPTFTHHLRISGYETILSGKAHFIGPDQLHGFEKRLITDIYPASFAWSPNWDEGVKLNPGANVEPVKHAGLCSWNLQLDYDGEVQYRTLECLREQARRLQNDDAKPFLLSVGYTHPHDPFFITSQWWGLYDHEKIDPPAVQERPIESLHPYNQWLQVHHGMDVFPLSPQEIRNARHAYYGMCSYLDSQIGELVAELKRLELYDNTLIIFTTDHGEMLGEHGMWYKRTFFEESVRVPMIFHWPRGIAQGRQVDKVVSLVDLFPTLCEIVGEGGSIQESEELDGDSFTKLLYEDDPNWKDEAISEYCGEGVLKPMRLLRKGNYKYVHIGDLPPLLFNLEEDPHEEKNISGSKSLKDLENNLKARVLRDWDDTTLSEQIARSQRNRVLLNKALTTGQPYSWDWRPKRDAAVQYVRRDAQIDNQLARYPRVDN